MSILGWEGSILEGERKQQDGELVKNRICVEASEGCSKLSVESLYDTVQGTEPKVQILPRA